jgi:hypothetical protein
MEARTVDFATTIRTRPFVASRPHDIDDNPQERAMKVSEHTSNLPPTPMCQPHPPALLPCSPPPPPPPSTLKSSQVGLALMHYFLPSSRITVLPSTRPPRVIRLASTSPHPNAVAYPPSPVLPHSPTPPLLHAPPLPPTPSPLPRPASIQVYDVNPPKVMNITPLGDYSPPPLSQILPHCQALTDID